jgi:predicted nucleic acid-binding protein
MIYLDSNVLLRYFILEPEPHLARLHRQSTTLLDSVRNGELEATISEVVLHEVASVLTSPRLYRVSRIDAAEYLATFVNLPGLRLARGDRSLFLRAIELFGRHSAISMADALIVARAERQQIPLATFDRALDRLPYAESWEFQD